MTRIQEALSKMAPNERLASLRQVLVALQSCQDGSVCGIKSARKAFMPYVESHTRDTNFVYDVSRMGDADFMQRLKSAVSEIKFLIVHQALDHREVSI